MNKKPPQIPSHVLQYMDEQRREQRAFNSLALVKGNLRDTTKTALNALDKLHQRGVQLNMAEDLGEELVHSSNIFLLEARPWWKRILFCQCLPDWWFDACKRNKRKKNEEEKPTPKYEINFVE